MEAREPFTAKRSSTVNRYKLVIWCVIVLAALWMGYSHGYSAAMSELAGHDGQPHHQVLVARNGSSNWVLKGDRTVIEEIQEAVALRDLTLPLRERLEQQKSMLDEIIGRIPAESGNPSKP